MGAIPSSEAIVPQLETDRLILRGWRDDDLDAYAEMEADPAVMRYIGGVTDPAGAWRSMALHAGHWTLRGYGLWVVTDRAEGSFLGRAGLWYPEGWPGPEIGWTFARRAWGHGYATEAAREIVTWAREVLGLAQLISVIDPSNERSIAVARRLGMDHLHDWSLAGQAVHIYGMKLPGAGS